MFDNDFFEQWLEQRATEVMHKVGEGQALSSEEMIILVLKAQSNHFAHLDTELRSDMQALREDMGKCFEAMDKRFEAMDKRFEDLIHYIDKRFEAVDKRFETVDKRFVSMQWTIGIGFSIIVLVTTLLKFIA